MANVFEGRTDGRQMTDEENRVMVGTVPFPTSRFRPRYRALNDAEKLTHDVLKEAYSAVETHIMRLPDGRYRALALTALEESCMWAVKELTA